VAALSDRGCQALVASQDGRTAADQGSVTGEGAERGQVVRPRGTVGQRGDDVALGQRGGGAALGQQAWQPWTEPARNGFRQRGGGAAPDSGVVGAFMVRVHGSAAPASQSE
jgi:hypothetical protein